MSFKIIIGGGNMCLRGDLVITPFTELPFPSVMLNSSNGFETFCTYIPFGKLTRSTLPSA